MLDASQLMKLDEQMKQPTSDMITVVTMLYCQRDHQNPISYKLTCTHPVNKTQDEILSRRIKLQPSEKITVCDQKLWMSSLSGVVLINRSETGLVFYGFEGCQHALSLIPGMYNILITPGVNDLRVWSSEPGAVCEVIFLPE